MDFYSVPESDDKLLTRTACGSVVTFVQVATVAPTVVGRSVVIEVVLIRCRPVNKRLQTLLPTVRYDVLLCPVMSEGNRYVDLHLVGSHEELFCRTPTGS